MSLSLNPSSHRVIDGTTRRLCTGLTHFLLLVAMLAMTASFSQATPEYALSGRASDLAAVEIARTDAGSLTALDLLIFDDLSGLNSLAGIPMEDWLDLKGKASGAALNIVESVARNLAVTLTSSERAGQWQPDPQLVRVMTFNAAIATWIEEDVIPQVKVTDTDIQRYYLANADKYLERQRLQVRYIFRKANLGSPEDTARVRSELEQVAFDVREGRMAFDEAAREFSEASSASDGGLLPPFYDGTYFDEFEKQAFALTTVGDLSGVFPGPEGLFLLKLESIWPVDNIPIETVRQDVADQLKYDLVRHYYAYLYKKMSAQAHVRSQAVMWNYMDLEAPIAYVGQKALTRNQFMRYYENPTDEQFGVRWNVVFRDSARWTEGEAIMQDLERRGLDHSPWIERAREIALAIQRGLYVLSHEVPPESYRDAEASLATLQSQPFFMGTLRQCRLIEFEYVPQSKPEMIAADRRAAQRLATRIDEQLAAGILPTEPNPVDLAQWSAHLVEADLKAPLKLLRQQVNESGWANVTFKLSDFGWVNCYPGSSWNGLIGIRKTGTVSEAYRMGAQTRRYLVIDERPIAPETMQENTALLRQLAHDMAGYGIFLKDVEQISDKGSVEFVY